MRTGNVVGLTSVKAELPVMSALLISRSQSPVLHTGATAVAPVGGQMRPKSTTSVSTLALGEPIVAVSGIVIVGWFGSLVDPVMVPMNVLPAAAPGGAVKVTCTSTHDPGGMIS